MYLPSHPPLTTALGSRAARLLACGDPAERELGAWVLRELGPHDDEGLRPFTTKTIGVVTAEMGDEPDPWVLGAMISVLGYHRAGRTLDLVLDQQAHPAQPVRLAVAAALPLLADPEQTQRRILEALLLLAADADDAVRGYALYALFNETAGVTAEERRTWATRLTGQAGTHTRRRDQLAHLATTLEDPVDTALRDILGPTTGS